MNDQRATEKIRLIDGPFGGDDCLIPSEMHGKVVALSALGALVPHGAGGVEYRPVVAIDGEPSRMDDGVLPYYHDTSAPDRLSRLMHPSGEGPAKTAALTHHLSATVEALSKLEGLALSRSSIPSGEIIWIIEESRTATEETL